MTTAESVMGAILEEAPERMNATEWRVSLTVVSDDVETYWVAHLSTRHVQLLDSTRQHKTAVGACEELLERLRAAIDERRARNARLVTGEIARMCATGTEGRR